MTIAVTGGTGFIGQVLVQQLLQNGYKVRLIIRKNNKLGPTASFPVEAVAASLHDKDSLSQALSGCSQLYHLAAYARSWSSAPDLFKKINVEGLKNVLEAALEIGVKRVVYVSSSVVLGPSSEKPLKESNNRNKKPYFTLYEESKALSEKIIPDYLKRGLEVLIARPTRVYGPGKLNEANSVTRIIRAFLRWRLALILNRGQEIGNYVYVEDVARGLRQMMEKGKSGEDYILAGENISLKGFYDLLEEVSGIKAFRIYVPARTARKLARLETWKAKHLRLYPLITEDWVETFLQNWAFSHEKAAQELGYQPLSLKKGLELTCRWLRGKNYDQLSW
ncbi:MAG: NAD-dependent epimerase/dehydratase family protein [Candidatus Aminicenantes bacterium]|nr:NAD-dependent epimerase/dehydratase family protein [Candidatus Aminicenantes bacterium]